MLTNLQKKFLKHNFTGKIVILQFTSDRLTYSVLHVLRTYCTYMHLSSSYSSESDSESRDDKPVVLSSLTPEELEKLKEAVEEKKKLITTLKGKPWPMKKKFVILRYVLNCCFETC